MTDQVLPEQFNDLEPWLDWSLETMAERSAKRSRSSMDELRVFYDAMLVRMDVILEYLAGFTPEDASESTLRLLYLTQSLAEVSLAVECFGEPEVSYAFDVARMVPGPE